MSREDSQFKLRMPSDLRDSIEAAAKEAKRSLNAEIITRLELSVIADDRSTQFFSAEQAREIAKMAERNLHKKLHDAIQRAITLSATSGISQASVSLSQFELDPDSQEDLKTLKEVLDRLKKAGYQIEMIGLDRLHIRF